MASHERNGPRLIREASFGFNAKKSTASADRVAVDILRLGVRGFGYGLVGLGTALGRVV